MVPFDLTDKQKNAYFQEIRVKLRRTRVLAVIFVIIAAGVVMGGVRSIGTTKRPDGILFAMAIFFAFAAYTAYYLWNRQPGEMAVEDDEFGYQAEKTLGFIPQQMSKKTFLAPYGSRYVRTNPYGTKTYRLLPWKRWPRESKIAALRESIVMTGFALCLSVVFLSAVLKGSSPEGLRFVILAVVLFSVCALAFLGSIVLAAWDTWTTKRLEK